MTTSNIEQIFAGLPQSIEIGGVTTALKGHWTFLKEKEHQTELLFQEFDQTTAAEKGKAPKTLKLNVGGKELSIRNSSDLFSQDPIFFPLLLLKSYWQQSILRDKFGRFFLDLDLQWFEKFLDYFRCQTMYTNTEVLFSCKSQHELEYYQQTMKFLNLSNNFHFQPCDGLYGLKEHSGILTRHPVIRSKLSRNLTEVFSECHPHATKQRRTFYLIPLFISTKLFITNRSSYYQFLVIVEDTDGNLFATYSDNPSVDQTSGKVYMFPLHMDDYPSHIRLKRCLVKEHICQNCTLFPLLFDNNQSSRGMSGHSHHNYHSNEGGDDYSVFDDDDEESDFDEEEDDDADHHSETAMQQSARNENWRRLEILSETRGRVPRRWCQGEDILSKDMKTVTIKAIEIYRIESILEDSDDMELCITTPATDELGNGFSGESLEKALLAPIPIPSSTTTSSTSSDSNLMSGLSNQLVLMHQFMTQVYQLCQQLQDRSRLLKKKQEAFLSQMTMIEEFLLKQLILCDVITQSNWKAYLQSLQTELSATNAANVRASPSSEKKQKSTTSTTTTTTTTVSTNGPLSLPIHPLLAGEADLTSTQEEDDAAFLVFTQQIRNLQRLCRCHTEKLQQAFLNTINTSTNTGEDPIAYLNVGGEKVCILKKTLLTFMPHSELSIRISGRWTEQPQEMDEDGYVFLDYPRESFLQLVSRLRLLKLQQMEAIMEKIRAERNKETKRVLRESKRRGEEKDPKPNTTSNKTTNQAWSDDGNSENEDEHESEEEEEEENESLDESENEDSDEEDEDEESVVDISDEDRDEEDDENGEELDDHSYQGDEEQVGNKRMRVYPNEESFLLDFRRSQYKQQQRASLATSSFQPSTTNPPIVLPIRASQAAVMRTMLDYLGVPAKEDHITSSIPMFATSDSTMTVFKIGTENGTKRRKLSH